jgi:hypothetical protein
MILPLGSEFDQHDHHQQREDDDCEDDDCQHEEGLETFIGGGWGHIDCGIDLVSLHVVVHVMIYPVVIECAGVRSYIQ